MTVGGLRGISEGDGNILFLDIDKCLWACLLCENSSRCTLTYSS